MLTAKLLKWQSLKFETEQDIQKVDMCTCMRQSSRLSVDGACFVVKNLLLNVAEKLCTHVLGIIWCDVSRNHAVSVQTMCVKIVKCKQSCIIFIFNRNVKIKRFKKFTMLQDGIQKI